jgi:hypothetical protein
LGKITKLSFGRPCTRHFFRQIAGKPRREVLYYAAQSLVQMRQTYNRRKELQFYLVRILALMIGNSAIDPSLYDQHISIVHIRSHHLFTYQRRILIPARANQKRPKNFSMKHSKSKKFVVALTERFLTIFVISTKV